MNLCRHFGECGGCSFQDTPYQEQLVIKDARLRHTLSDNGLHTAVKPIQRFSEWYYRNKMEFTFSQINGSLLCGLHGRNTQRQLVNLEECLIFSPDTGRLLDIIREFGDRQGYCAYNRLSHKGYLRHLIIRESKFTKELMVGIVTTGEQPFNAKDFVKALKSADIGGNIKSIYWVTNDALSDAVIFQNKELLFGRPFIQEDIDGFKFNIGIDSFFQVNPKGVRALYTNIRDYAGLRGRERLIDLYCGVGCIGIFLAPGAEFVWGVELRQALIDAALGNAELNNIENINFITADTRRFLSLQGHNYKGIDLVVVNPPRSGLSKKVVRGILRLGARSIIYSSCNPQALAHDLKSMEESYNIEFVEPFDFFPHTPHMECVAVLRKKD